MIRKEFSNRSTYSGDLRAPDRQAAVTEYMAFLRDRGTAAGTGALNQIPACSTAFPIATTRLSCSGA